MQAEQKEWPHGVVTGSYNNLKHSLHSKSSRSLSILALLELQSPPVSVRRVLTWPFGSNSRDSVYYSQLETQIVARRSALCTPKNDPIKSRGL